MGNLAEWIVLSLLLILLVVGLGLVVLLTVGALFFQGYFYTEPERGLLWRAPAAALILTLFFAFWCWLNATSRTATPGDIPYNTIDHFSARVEMTTGPVPRLWSLRKGNSTPIEYKLWKEIQGPRIVTVYKEKLGAGRPWNPAGVEAILLEHEGEKLRFEPRQAAEGGYREFVNEKGWTMKEFEDGLNGIPTMSRWDRLLGNLLLNLFHLALWFAALWLLVRFQWPHALGLALVLWIVLTFLVLPMLLHEAARVAQQVAMTSPT